VSFTAVTPIEAMPAFRLYFNGVEGSTISERVLLHRADGQPLDARLVGTTLERGITVELAPVQGGEEPVGRLTPQPGDQWLVATLESAAAGNHDGMITLATNDPRASKLELPLIVRVRPVIEMRPSPVRLWPADGGPSGTSMLVRLSHSQRSAFEVTGIEVADPKLVSAKLDSSGSQQIHSLRVTLAEGVTVAEGTLRTTVRIATSDSTRPLLELPVEVSVRHQGARRPLPPTPAADVSAKAPAGGG
jgi:hypothetical protein